MNDESRRVTFLQDLADVVDGDPEALARHRDLMRENAAVRELRLEADRLADRIANAGADFRPDPELASRVLAAIDGGESPQPSGKRSSEPIVGGGEERVHVSNQHDEDEYEDDEYEDDEYEDDEYEDDEYEDDEYEEEPPPPPKRKAAKEKGKKSPKKQAAGASRSRVPLLMGLLVVLLAAGGAAAYMTGMLPLPGSQAGPAPSKPVEVQVPKAATAGGGGAKIDQLRTSAADGGGLLVIAGKESKGEAGNPVPAGATLRTDARTRAGIELDGGARLLLDHGTEIALPKGKEGMLSLRTGEILLTSDGSGAKLGVQAPHGSITLEGTQLLVSASEAGTTVRVIRGEVQVTPKQGDGVAVLAGHEAVLPAEGAPSVAPMMHLSSALRWTEIDTPDEQQWLPGLGELTARVPGAKEDEQDSPLKLAEHKVKVRIAGSMARTEIEELFVNEQQVELEGIYRFPLPPDARIEGLSLEVDGKWHEGSFVERERAKKIFRGAVRKGTPKKRRAKKEEFVWVPGPWRDPALLEWQRGGRFELRIFPIPAGAERRIRISYSQALPRFGDGRRYVYPLPQAGEGGLEIGRFEVDAEVLGAAQGGVRAAGYDLELTAAEGEGATKLALSEESFVARGDLAIQVAPREAPGELSHFSYEGEATVGPGRSRSPAAKVQAQAHKDDRPYVAFALRPALPPWQESVPRHYTLVIDSSQSMYGERWTRARAIVTRTIAEMDRRDTFQVLACDAGCDAREATPGAPSSQTAAEVGAWLEQRRPAGASDLSEAMTAATRWLTEARAGEAAKALEGRNVHLVYVGDGLASVGPRDNAELVARASDLAKAGTRLTTVGVGSDSDGRTLAQLARAGGGRHVPFVPGQRTLEVAMSVLETGYAVTLDNPKLILPEGLSDVAPATLPTLRAGEEVIVTARLDEGSISGELVLTGQVGGEAFENRYPVEIEPSQSDANRFVAPLWASARIERLELEDNANARLQAIALSRAYGMISRHTSLLVLESEAMFEAFGEDPGVTRPTWTGEEEAEEGTGEATYELGNLGSVGSGAGAASSRSSGKGKAKRPRAAARKSKPRRPRGPVRADSPFDGRNLPPPSEAGRGEALDIADAELEVAGGPVEPEASEADPGRWMKKEVYRASKIQKGVPARESDRKRVDDATDALRENTDSRDLHRRLVRALERQGNHERAISAIGEWLARDALDPEALTYLSDAHGRQGERDLALRLLTGTVDLQPDNVRLHERLARAYDRAKLPSRACAHRVALAEIEPGKNERAAAAVRCLRATGQEGPATRALERLDERRRERVQALSAEPAEAEKQAGELLVTATWETEADLDLSIVTNQGTRISWMGGRVDTFGADALSQTGEQLGIRRAVVGNYVIEVTRTSADDGLTPIKGKLVIEALGSKREVPFDLRGTTARVARVMVARETRLVPP